MEGVIYKATNKINGKAYIGKTVQSFRKRKNHHKSNVLNFNSNYLFCKAMRKYGFNNFEWKIIDSDLFEDRLFEKEIYWIKKLKAKAPNGYNLTDGGEGTSGRKTGIYKKCLICKKEMYVTLWKNKNKNKNYCSKECRNIGRKTGKWVKCPICNKEFWIELNKEKLGRKYCSNKCRFIGIKKSLIHKKCLTCNKDIYILPSQINRKYCSSRCAKIDKPNLKKRKKYIFTNLEGKEFIYLGFDDFCKRNNLNNICMHNVLSGRTKQYKGWEVKYV